MIIAMIILGIDPGSLKTGHALIELTGRKITYLHSGVCHFNKKIELIDRLGLVYKSAEDLILQYRPDEISLESLIYVKSVPALAKLAQARGAMLAAFAKDYEKRIFEYSPTSIKSSVAGYGHGSKELVQRTLKMLFKGQLHKEFETEDESDALAIAMTHGLLRDHYRRSQPKTQQKRQLRRQ